MPTYPLAALRALALHTQSLDVPNGSEPKPGPDSVYGTIQRIGAVQIDTLQVAARAQYLTIWSRHGTYDPEIFDRLAYHPAERRMFEGWQHAACYIPIDEYRYQMPQQRSLRENPGNWYTRWLDQLKHPEVVELVRAHIQTNGAAKVSDFERGDHPAGSWWNWRPAKVALEYLFAFGDLMIADRVRFQRAYDLTERVLPAWVDRSEPSAEERDRFWVERGAKALGVCAPRHPGDYTWMKITKSRPIVRQLLEAGTLVEVRGETLAGQQDLIVHRDNLALLEKAAGGEIRAQRTTFLNPFDNLWWAQGRDELFWGFRQRLEAYTPAPKRIYGYYCLPILHRDRLVGRFDPKLERGKGLLRLKALHLEPGIAPDEQLVHDVATALRDFMRFHKATELVIEKSNPPEFGEKLGMVM
jgi:uncharacterized protein YcaQ